MNSTWRKSSHSTAANNCVEVRGTTGGIDVRDTKDNGLGPILSFSSEAWADFVYDLPEMTTHEMVS